MINYTTTTFKAREKIGDSIFHNNMVTSGTMTITPNIGYVVTASDFSITTLPSEISAATFTDTSTAGQLGNTVTITATFASDFVSASPIDMGMPVHFITVSIISLHF